MLVFCINLQSKFFYSISHWLFFSSRLFGTTPKLPHADPGIAFGGAGRAPKAHGGVGKGRRYPLPTEFFFDFLISK